MSDPHYLQENSIREKLLSTIVQYTARVLADNLGRPRHSYNMNHIGYRIRPSLIISGYDEISFSVFLGTILHDNLKITIFEFFASDWTDTSEAPKN